MQPSSITYTFIYIEAVKLTNTTHSDYINNEIINDVEESDEVKMSTGYMPSKEMKNTTSDGYSPCSRTSNFARNLPKNYREGEVIVLQKFNEERKISGKRESTKSRYCNINTIVNARKEKNPIEVKNNLEKRATQQPDFPKMRNSSGYVVRINNDKSEATQIEKYNVKEVESDEEISEDDSVSEFNSDPLFSADNSIK